VWHAGIFVGDRLDRRFGQQLQENTLASAPEQRRER
jgi:hypothetical protein